MDFEGKRILVIGGAGFIGSHLVDALCREDVKEITVYDNFTRGSVSNLRAALEDPRVRINDTGGDILHFDILTRAMQGVDAVFHLAALWLLHCHEFPRSAFEVNIRGTFNVLQAVIDNGVKRLVYSSSASVYGDAISEPMTEDHPFNNTNFYGATKISGEAMLRACYYRWKESEKHFDYVGLRYMNVFGARQDYHGAYVAVIMKMLDRIDQGLPLLVFGDGSQSYDFIAVQDVARANVCAMQSSATDAFYNVGTGTKTSIKELAEAVLEVSGSSVGIQFEPAGQTFVKNRVGCPRRAADELGFTAALDLRAGIRELIAWRNQDKQK